MTAAGAQSAIRNPQSAIGLPWIAAAAVVLVFLGHDTKRLWAPFGPSHDGFNAALYMTGGRAIVEEGPLVSRLGAASTTQATDRVVYAHHPPLIYLTEAIAFLLPGPVEWAARLPAIFTGLAGLVFTVLLLQHAGVGPGAAAMGVLVGFATRMFFVFGAVPEPHIMGLAGMAALSLVWQRLKTGELSLWVPASVAALVALTSWQGALFAGLVGVGMLLEKRRGPAFAVWLGTAAGVGGTALWILWAYGGDLQDFLTRAVLRTGAGTVDQISIPLMIRNQMHWLHQGFPVGRWLVVPVALCGWFDHRTRPYAVTSLATVLAYAVVFKNAAGEHSYWLYNLIFPVSLGAAAASDAVARWLRGRSPAIRPVPVVVGAALTTLLAISLWRPSEDQDQNAYAAQVGAEARAIAWPEGQRYAYHMFGDLGQTDLLPWLRFYARREPMGVAGPDSVPTGEVVLRSVEGHLRAMQGQGPAGGHP